MTDQRPSASKRGYDARWRKLRAVVLAQSPLCRFCEARGRTVQANEVDHIKPLADGGTHDAANLQPLCKPCHSRKTGRGNKLGERGCDIHGRPLDPAHYWNI